MQIRFWGTRGSIARPGPDTLRYGGTLPIVVITANEQPHHLSAAFDAGATDYLTKPIQSSLLRARAHAWLLRRARAMT